MHTMLWGLGRGGRILTLLSGTLSARAAAPWRRSLCSSNRSINPLMRSCGPVCGMPRTANDTSSTASPSSTPSLKSSKKRSFTRPPWRPLRPSRQGAGVLAVAQQDLAVDHRRGDAPAALCEALRAGGQVVDDLGHLGADGGRVEDDEVGGDRKSTRL